MATPSSCFRCQKPLAVDSVNGLCVTCSQAIETEQRTGTPQLPEPTASESIEQGDVTRTANFDPAADTQLWDGKVRNRATPSGFELLRYLGGGGMGDVYLALEYAADRRVAMKFLRAAADPRAAVRFVKEIRALAKLEHPNIIRVIAVELDRADPFFTMEYAAGGTLTERVKAEGTMSPEDAAQLFVRLARAVQAAHTEQILHRDIKPSNIVLAEDGTPKLSDFGLAKRMDEELDTRTLASVAVGTPPYMPPEAVSRRHGDFCEATDVYGLGATLFFTLTGRAPFIGENHVVMRQVETKAPPRPRSIRPDLPLALEAIVLKCLEKKPADRYSSAEALAQDLERFLGGAKPVAPPMTRPRRVKQWVVRNWAVIASVASVAIVVVLLAPNPVAHTDPRAEIQRELSQGRSVTLIGPKGLPQWSDRPIAGIEVGEDIDGVCRISAVGEGLVVLHPQLGIDRYELEGEFQATGFLGGQRANPDPEQWCGFMLGYHIQPLPGNERLHSFVGTTFRDFDRGLTLEMARLGVSVISERPGRNPEHVLGGSGPFKKFAPSPTLPGKWRKVKYIVGPDRIQAFWRTEAAPGESEGKLERFADWSDKDLAVRTASTHQTMRAYVPALNGTIPEWAPNRGVALWCVRAAFAVRNVTVTPLDSQP